MNKHLLKGLKKKPLKSEPLDPKVAAQAMVTIFKPLRDELMLRSLAKDYLARKKKEKTA